MKIVCTTLLIILTNLAVAENLRFPSTEAEIVKALSPPILTKGLGEIRNDVVGALIYFEFDSAIIKKESYPLLHEYVKALKGELAQVTIEIAGHTDSQGKFAYNLALSKRRAKAVQEFLGCGQTYIKGYGESRPIESNNTAIGRAKNRRVEFIRR